MAESNVSERRRPGLRRVAPMLAPLVVGVVALTTWEMAVRWWETPPYLLPGPVAIAGAIHDNAGRLYNAWQVTFGTMTLALLLAVVAGVVLAVVFTSSRIVELSLFPYAVVLQVTPLVAVAPLLVIWINDPTKVKLICAWIVAFFPILSNSVVGLRSADPGLRDLFQLYGAATDKPGLASLVFEGQYLSDGPLTFAALAIISLTGIVMYFATHLLSLWLLGGWHASATK